MSTSNHQRVGTPLDVLKIGLGLTSSGRCAAHGEKWIDEATAFRDGRIPRDAVRPIESDAKPFDGQ